MFPQDWPILRLWAADMAIRREHQEKADATAYLF
jgi:hypothetical protein